jgi:hypothetical protein
MTKLSDLQLILLTTASQRADGNLLPAPDSINGAGCRLKKSLAGLLKRSLVSEGEVKLAQQGWREEGDVRFGLSITDQGREAIGDVPKAVAPSEDAQQGEAQPLAAQTKKAAVIELLKREQGATLQELVEATGWLPHTTRAALTGLRKRGMEIEKSMRAGLTCYAARANS